ncbi:MAG TPA: Ig-like domain-containing protein, partial [Acidobacteriaceae bacterium]|nr:Ig-like domain-containing protein [Acidobacteriaceae bacterium]
MKRIAAFSVVLCLAGLFGCGGGGNQGNNSTPTPPTLSSIAVSPSTSTLWVALNTQQFTATGHYSDGTTKDLTAGASWSSSSPNVAVVSTRGVGTPVAAGTVTISAASGGMSGTSTVTVVGLATGYIAPSGPTLSLTGSPSAAQLSATAVWTDGKTQDLTS